jgi:hypothetical protein
VQFPLIFYFFWFQILSSAPLPQTLSFYSELLGFRTLSIIRYSKNQKTQRFGNWICFSRVGVSPLTWGRKQTEFPKRCVFLYFLEYRTMDKVRNPSKSEWHTPSSEPFTIYCHSMYFPLCQRPIFTPIQIYS